MHPRGCVVRPQTVALRIDVDMPYLKKRITTTWSKGRKETVVCHDFHRYTEDEVVGLLFGIGLAALAAWLFIGFGTALVVTLVLYGLLFKHGDK